MSASYRSLSFCWFRPDLLVRNRSATGPGFPTGDTWNLADLYPSDAAWRAAKDKVVADIPQVRAFKGTLGTGATRLADALELVTRLTKDLSRIYTYASLVADQDTRVSAAQGMRQEMQQVAASFGSDVAFVEPDILKIDKAALDSWIAKEPRLEVYTHYLEDFQRRRAHTLSDAEEKLLASSSVVSSAPGNTYNIFSNADFPYPTVTLSDGKSVKLDSSSFNLYRAVPNRDDRQKVMSAFFGALGQYGGTFGSTLNGQVQANEFYAHARKYDSALEAALDGPAIPMSVYSHLVDGVNQALPTFQRYLQLRKRMMKLNELHYYDLYAPLVGSVDLTYTPEESEKHVLAALAPLGADYVAAVKRAFNERWIDLLPSEGKASGAYSSGSAYDVHPYMLINFNWKYTDVSTVAHELGHTMQSYLSNKAQPSPLAAYPIFVAEVASTFNEALLIDYMLKTIKDDNTKLSLLGNYLENIKGTVFRQTQFAEFELRAHEMAEKGQPITGEALGQALPRRHPQVLRTRQRRLHCRRLHRARVGVHPPLLSELLRLPVRDVVYRVGCAFGEGADRGSGRDQAVPGVSLRRRVEISDRSPEGRRRRHDHQRTASAHDAEDEPGHGRYGDLDRETVSSRFLRFAVRATA